MKSYCLITPEGTRDLLFDECIARKNEEEKLRELFISHGYSEIISPALEFYDVFFNTKARSFNQEDMYKLTDGKGRLMVLRPDSTMPIARIAATRLKDSVYPLKLFYSQSIYRSNPKMAGRDDEIMQSGIEIIGGDELRSDIEALSIAAKVLNSCGSDDVRLEIGDNTFYKYLLKSLDVEDDEELIRSLIESKNTPELKKYIEKSDFSGKEKEAKMLLELPSLFGGSEVFDKAGQLFSGTALSDRLDKLQSTYNSLCTLYQGDKINVDLGLVNKAEYYTGIIFRGYIEEYGQAVISGGRYDTLIGSFGVSDKPAIGFAANVNAIAMAVLRKAKAPLYKSADVLVFAQQDKLIEGIRHCGMLIESGIKAEFSASESEQSAKEYAVSKGIKKLCVVGDGITEIEL